MILLRREKEDSRCFGKRLSRGSPARISADSALDQQKAEANQMAEKLVEYNILQARGRSHKSLYDGLMTKLKENAIAQGLRSSNIRVVDPAMDSFHTRRVCKGGKFTLAFIVVGWRIGWLSFASTWTTLSRRRTTSRRSRACLPLAVVPSRRL